MIACTPSAIPAAVRFAHRTRACALFGDSVVERRELPGGFAYRFEPDMFDEIVRWVTYERCCCPFLAFTIDLSAERGPLWLRIEGPPGTHRLLETELGTS